MSMQCKVTPWLGFNDQAEEAATFYTSLLPNSRIERISRNPADGYALVVEFVLGGLPVRALNARRDWQFTEAFSFSVACETQEEIDRLWDALTAGGREIQCGWLVDRFGVHWQIVPSQVCNWLSDPDPAKVARVLDPLTAMKKLNIAAMQAAYEGRDVTP